MTIGTCKTYAIAQPNSALLRFVVIAFLMMVPALLRAQTDCSEGNGVLDTTPPKSISTPELIAKIGAAESRVRQSRTGYSYTQDVLIQTLAGKSIDGQFHEVTTVSYDSKGRRVEKVVFAEQPTLRNLRLSQEDMDDIRIFMPLILATDELPLYNLTYAGQQRVDDLDTYVLHVEPRREEKDKRYFQGRIWVDSQDFQIVKLCGKSVPEEIHVKKNQQQDLRPTFVTYRQPVEGFWFPAYTRVDDTLHFRSENVHLKEVIKFSGYRKVVDASMEANPSR